MRPLRAHRRFVLFVPLASATIALLFACTQDEPLGWIDTPSDGSVSETTTPAGDAGIDAADAAADAAPEPRTCSDDGFCHIPLPNDQSLRGVWGDGSGTVWAVSEEGSVLRWDGTVWASHSSLSGALRTIWGSGPTDIWIGGVAGLFHGQGPTSSAVVFSPVPIDSTIPIASIHGFGPNDVWAVGGRLDPSAEESLVLHYRGPTGDPATDWKVDPISSRVFAASRVWGTGPNDVWLGGTTFLGEPQGAVIMHGRSNGSGGTEFEDVVVRNPNGTPSDQLLEVTGGAVLSDVFVIGRYWTGMGVAWAGRPEPLDGGDPDAGAGIFWDGNTFGTYFGFLGVWGTSKDDVWIVGEMGRVRHWNGTSWSLPSVTITKFPLTKNLHAIWGNGSGEMWIVGDDTAIRRGPSAPKGDP